MARIELRRLSKSFRVGRGQPVPAVSDLELTIEPGELMVLVGPSGSGKSTTLRLVAGLEEPSSGEVRFDGVVMNHCPAHLRDVAMVFQRDALYPHMTVYQNLSLGLRLRQEPNLDPRVRETAALLGLEDLLDRLPRELSGGQRQRVAVGRAIVRRPAVFLFDEPFTSLDGPLRGQLRREIALLQRQLKVTTLYVTHDQGEAMVLGDRISVFHQGRLQQVATPVELYARPANSFVAALFGTPPMNLLRMVVLPEARGVALAQAQASPGSAPFRLDLTDFQKTALLGLVGREVIVGVRPEDVAVGDSLQLEPAWGTGKVEWVEWLGAEMVVRLNVAGHPILARFTASSPIPMGTVLGVGLDPARARFFDVSTGQALL
jgi:ABC-type sugar transport system ATPase subunit